MSGTGPAGRWALISSWYAGLHGHWRAAAQSLAHPDRRPPLAVPVAACPALVACRHPRRPALPKPERTPRRALLRRHDAGAAYRGRSGFTCPAVERMAACRGCVGALAAHRLLAPQLVVVGAGVDTLELHTKLPVGPWHGGQLEALFEVARQAREAQPYEVAGLELQLQPRTVKGGWLLKNPAGDLVVRVRPEPQEDEAAIVVELHSAALWSMGWRKAGEQARRVCEELAGSDDVDLQVTRIDLCVDFQGWQPGPEDRELFVSRAKKRGRFREGHVEPQWDDAEWLEGESGRIARAAAQLERATSHEQRRAVLELFHKAPQERATEAEFEAGRLAFTGFAFGMGHHLSARLYNKSREIRRSRKTWFETIWERAPGYRHPPGGTVNGSIRSHFDVWRLEFQLRRDAVREFTFKTGEGSSWLDLASWDDCAANLDRAWHYLTRHWLRHGWRSADDRAVLSAPWRALHFARIGSGEAVEGLERVIARCGVDPSMGAAFGYVSTVAALQLEARAEAEAPGELAPAPDYAATMVQVLMAAQQRAEERAQQSLEKLIDEKRTRIRERKAFLAQRDRTRTERRQRRAASAQRYGRHEGLLVKRDEEDDRNEERSAVWRAERARMEAERIRSIVVPF